MAVLGIFLTQLRTDLNNLARIECVSCFKENDGLRSRTKITSDLKDSKRTGLYRFDMSVGRCWIFFPHS